MINITDSAKQKINEILLEESNPDIKLRVFVQGGGCSGFQYGFTLEDTANEDDWQYDIDTFKLVVDPMSMTYLDLATIDYTENLDGSQFIIKNPNAKTTCGCGSSFDI